MKAWRFLVLAALWGAAGCDGLAPERPAALRVTVLDAGTGAPQGGVKLVLMDVATDGPLGDPAATAADGAALFSLPREGRFQVLAFPSGGRGVFAAAPPIAPADSARPGPWGRAAADTLRARVLTWRAPEFADGLPRISGRVVDAFSGKPLAGAFLGLADRARLAAYSGEFSVREDVTDAAGRFHVAEIPFALDPESGLMFQVVPLLVARAGYVPAAWRYDVPHGDDNLDITEVTIPLEPATATGGLRGRLLCAGRPAAGVTVGVAFGGLGGPAAGGDEAAAGRRLPGDWRAQAAAAPTAAAAAALAATGAGRRPPGGAAPASALVPGLVGLTDAEGRFVIAGLSPGLYALHPGFAVGDGWAVPWTDFDAQAAEGGVTDLGDRPVAREVAFVRPLPGETLPDTLPRLSWSAVAEADSYAVFVDGAYRGAGAAPVWQPPPGGALAPGRHELAVLAFTAEGEIVGCTEGRARFLVALPAARR